jgi:hypothetical protein
MFSKITIKDIQKDGLETIACTDLGAYHNIGKNHLKQHGIDAVVIMEDRLPDFFLTYNEFEPHKDTSLNRHGPFKLLFTQLHLKELIKELHEQGIKVYLGFWGQLFDPHKKYCLPWIDKHTELWRLHAENNKNTDLDPLVTLMPENTSFAQIILNQFKKFKRDFDFDGLFLGDGLNGYRLFIDPNQYEDQENTKHRWTRFYKTLATGLDKIDCKLLAYDCMGFNPDRAIMHGADYLAQAEVGLHNLIVQTYPCAWGKKWLKNFKGFDFKSCEKNLKATKEKLKKTKCKTFYTLEMGDNVEGWQPKKRITKKQLKHFKNIADGKLIVWANNLFYKLLK